MCDFEEKVREIKTRRIKEWFDGFEALHKKEDAGEGTLKEDNSGERTYDWLKGEIDELALRYGYRKVADAFKVTEKQYYYEFNEYVTEEEYFESDDEDLIDLNDKLSVYKAYCRWRPYWPALISTASMNVVKTYVRRVRYCHGQFFTLTVRRACLSDAVDAACQCWPETIRESLNRGFSVHADYPSFYDTSEYSMTDAEFETIHVQYQSEKLKQLVLELIEKQSDIELKWIKAYTLCHARSVTPEDWGPDVYVLPASDRAEIIDRLAARIGKEETAKLFGKHELDAAGVDLGIALDGASEPYDYYFLRGDEDRANGFAIFENDDDDPFLPSYRPDVEVDKYLLPAFDLKMIQPCNDDKVSSLEVQKMLEEYARSAADGISDDEVPF